MRDELKQVQQAEMQQKHDARLVKEMLATDGWKIIEQYLVEKSRELTTQLIQEDESSKDHGLKSDIRAIDSLLSAIRYYGTINTEKTS